MDYVSTAFRVIGVVRKILQSPLYYFLVTVILLYCTKWLSWDVVSRLIMWNSNSPKAVISDIVAGLNPGVTKISNEEAQELVQHLPFEKINQDIEPEYHCYHNEQQGEIVNSLMKSVQDAGLGDYFKEIIRRAFSVNNGYQLKQQLQFEQGKQIKFGFFFVATKRKDTDSKCYVMAKSIVELKLAPRKVPLFLEKSYLFGLVKTKVEIGQDFQDRSLTLEQSKAIEHTLTHDAVQSVKANFKLAIERGELDENQTDKVAGAG